MARQTIFSALATVSAAALVAASPLSTPYNYSPERRTASVGVAPLQEGFYPYGTIDNAYIVIFKDDVHPQLMQNHLNFLEAAHDVDPLMGVDASGLTHLYDSAVKGYAGKFTNRVLEQIRRSPEVAHVERDQIVRTQNVTLQNGAPWGLARISHRERLRFGTFSRYAYNEIDGEGVDVYVVDTGINVNHVEFDGGRASWGKTIPTNDEDEDNNGHGTHCAGTIASKSYGVSKKANVIAVKVLGSNGSGSMSDVISGVNWAFDQADSKKIAADREFAATGYTAHKGSVASMSLGGGKSPALDRAVNAAVTNGLHFAVAAGNDNADACKYSPASAEEAVTVGASTLGDERAYFSNYGECVDVFGPGLNIKSTYNGPGNNSVAILSGTSMATPHVAGLLAYLLSIYPSKEFSLAVGEDFVVAESAAAARSAYALVMSVMPSWVVAFLPSSGLLSAFTQPLFGEAVFAPTPRPSLTPKQLKAALLGLSTPDVLSDIPKKTPNLLIFNNITALL